jgi:serine/threonine-protein kinase ATR
MLRNLEDDDVEIMLESTFSTIIQRWETFNEMTRRRAEGTLQYLLKQRTRLIRNTIVNLPSLAKFPEFDSVERQLNKIRTPTDIGNAFQIFCRRVSHENPGVVAQALVELKAYLRLHQSFLQASAVSEQPDLVVGLLVRSVLDACVKFNEAHHDIAQVSAECIGLIGCLDSNRVESVRERSEMVVVNNFREPVETTNFVLYMLKEVIVKAFLSTTDTGVQGFLSLVMQKLLQVCNFSDVCPQRIMKGEGKDSDNPVFRKWLALPGSVQETLTPFLTSRFAVKEMEKPTVKYPIFCLENARFDKIYRYWLTTFVLELLYKPYTGYSELIFPPLRRAIKIRSLSIANFLLPYLVVHVIVEGTDQDREDVVNELLGVLKCQPTPQIKIQEEDLKMCSEVSLHKYPIHVSSDSLFPGCLSGSRLFISMDTSKASRSWQVPWTH